MADQMLADARLMLQNSRLHSAADRAYYAMFHAAMAALSREVPRLPKTHSGTRTLFARHLVATGKVEPSLFEYLKEAFELRQAGTYEVGIEVEEAEVRTLIAHAEAFVARMKQLLAVA